MREFKRIALWVASIFFLILGVIGLALPFLQGFLFIAIGLALLALSSHQFRTWLESHTRNYPTIHAHLQRTLDWLERNIGRPE